MKFPHTSERLVLVSLASSLLLLLALTLGTAPAHAALDPTSFASKVDFATGAGPYGVAVADLNSDGKPDVVVANRGGGSGNTVSVFKNTSTSGNISFAPPVTVAVGNQPVYVAIGDIDGNGIPDVVVDNENDNTISVLLNTSSGGNISFAAAVNIPVGIGPLGVAIADLDKDNKLDIVVANYNGGTGNTITLLHNASTPGNITFDSTTTATVGAGPVDVAVGDLDGDGKLDVAVTDFGTGSGTNLSILHNSSTIGNISFDATTSPAVGTGPHDVMIADLDGDGKPDVAATNYNSSSISILRNTSAVGSISLVPAGNLPTVASPTGLEIKDLDGDGKPDLAAANFGNSGGNALSVYQNTSTGGLISFAARVDYVTGTGPAAVASGDIDGDGKPDLAVTNNGSNSVSVLRNINSPYSISFATPGTPFTVGSGPVWIAIGDIDGDGKPDLAVTNFGTGTGNTISVLRNTSTVVGTASFASAVPITVGSGAHHAAIGDIDGDGKPDLVVTNYGDGTVSVLHNSSTSGTISFDSTQTFTVGLHPIGVAIGDIDGDGKPDLVVANNGDGTVTVLRNTTIGATISFAAQGPFTVQSQPWDVAIGDLDGDGKLDVAVTNNGSATVSTLHSTSTSGTISFDATQSFKVGNQPYGLGIADLDGDTKLDLAVANSGSNTVSVLRNLSTSGAISFATEASFPVGTGPVGLAIGDLGGDAKPDLAVTDFNSGSGSTVSVLRNLSSSGTVSFSPSADFGAGAGPLGVAIGPIDPDGKLDLAIANYGSGNGNTVTVLLSTTNKPTAVTLSQFSGVAMQDTPGRIMLSWTTASEVNTVGFNIYRSNRREGPYVRITARLIDSSPDGVAGSTYEFQDKDIKSGQTYYYQLEDIGANGRGERHTPIKVITESSPQANSNDLLVVGIALSMGFLLVGGSWYYNWNKAKNP